MGKKSILISIGILSCFVCFASDLVLAQKDLAVIQDPKGEGYHFYIKKKPDVASVLITETTKDSHKRLHNFAYRSPDYNRINGDEKRILNGKELDIRSKKLYSLIDSTPEKNTPVGEAFHVWVPYIIVYGYEWSRNGEVQVLDGTFFNIRTFEKPYADYAGSFHDNPFVLRVTQKPIHKKTKTIPDADKASFSSSAVSAFSDLAGISGNRLYYAKKLDEIMPAIKAALAVKKNKKIDIVFVIDATESMKDDIKHIRKYFSSELKEQLGKYESYRLALVLYKDYNDDFLVKTACGFTDSMKRFNKALNSFHVFGGRDIPEAVYEGLNAGLILEWNQSQDVDRRLVLIGDAPPHPRSKGKITKERVMKRAEEKKVVFFPIILPHKKVY